MKVLFVNPPTLGTKPRIFNRPGRFPNFPYASRVLTPPLLLAYATSYVRARGHDVSFIDAQVLDMDAEMFFTRAEEICPDFAVFETSTPSFGNDVKIADEVKRRTGCKTVFLGTHVSALPEESLEASTLDAVVMGEYELPLGEYIDRGPKGVKGLAYRENGKIVVNPPREPPTDLDSFPFPARDLMPNDRYFDPILKHPFTYFLAGRGCPYRCSFCNWPQVLWGHTYRVRSPKNIVDELEYIEANYRFKSIQFNDDTFGVNREHGMAVCDEIIARGIKMEWSCYARADFGSQPRDIPLLKRLRRAGCFQFKVGVESGNQQILKRARKGTTLDRIRRGIRTMKELGFDVHATFIFGLLGETEETLEQTIKFAKELAPTTAQFSTAVPFPKTEFYESLRQRDYLTTDDWSEYLPGNPTYSYPNLSADQIRGALKTAYRKYYFRGRYIPIVVKGVFTEPFRYLNNIYALLKYTI